MRVLTHLLAICTALLAASYAPAAAQPPQTGLVQPIPPPTDPVRRAPAVRRVSESVYTINHTVQVNMARREVTVVGRVNDVAVLEFVANAVGGAKDYESLLTLDADGIALNTALLLVGLDPARGRVPERQFDPVPPKGDPVALLVTWGAGDGAKDVPVEALMLDQRTGEALKQGPWVYTGSTFVPTPAGDRFLAELDGVLIGMMRGPSALIDSPRDDVLGGFGAIVFNPGLGLKAGTPVTLTIRALPRRSP